MRLLSIITVIILSLVISCQNESDQEPMKIIFLHHSTGNTIWKGANTGLMSKVLARINTSKAQGELPKLFETYNEKSNKNYIIKEQPFPKSSPYGWKNYPFDYYNIWVKNGDQVYYMEEPTLNALTHDHDVIIFKHCFPVSNIKADTDNISIDSEEKTIGNYMLQYEAIKDKLLQYPEVKFILFTGAVQVESRISKEEALRAKEFYDWVITEWDDPGDNIFIWDFYSLQTDGGLYFKNSYAVSPDDSHPNPEFAGKAADLLFQRIVDVIENNGMHTSLQGYKE